MDKKSYSQLVYSFAVTSLSLDKKAGSVTVGIAENIQL